MTIYDYVKLHSGLTKHEAIHRLATKIRTYMNKNEIEKMTPELIKKVQKMNDSTVY